SKFEERFNDHWRSGKPRSQYVRRVVVHWRMSRKSGHRFSDKGHAQNEMNPARIPIDPIEMRASRRTEKPMYPQKPEDVIGAAQPFTGAQYLESLRDGREVYIYGERVKDVTAHPAFRNAARSIARLYDALHDSRTREALVSPTDTGSGGFTHKFFRVAHSREDVVGQRDAIAP